jgi:thioredoxin 2
MIATCTKCQAKNRIDETAAVHQQPVCGRCGSPLELAPPGTGADGSKPRVVTDASFERDVLGAGPTPLLVDCWASWCTPCLMIAPVLDELASESQGRYVIAKLNVDENPQVSGRFGIRSIPTMLIFKNGKLVDTLVGALPKQTIAARLAKAA